LHIRFQAAHAWIAALDSRKTAMVRTMLVQKEAPLHQSATLERGFALAMPWKPAFPTWLECCINTDRNKNAVNLPAERCEQSAYRSVSKVWAAGPAMDTALHTRLDRVQSPVFMLITQAMRENLYEK